MLDYKREIILRPLMKCNWNCEYCGFNESDLTKIEFIDETFTLEMIEYMFSKYSDNEYLISGGEPGLLSFDFFNKLIKLINDYHIEKIDLETNGTVFKYDLDFSKFRLIRYHAVVDIAKNDYIQYTDFPDDWNIEIITILTKNSNLSTLESHIRKYEKLFKRYICNVKPEMIYLSNSNFIMRLILMLLKLRKEGFKTSYRYIKDKELIDLDDIHKCMSEPKIIDISFSTNYIALCCYFSFLADNDLKITKENLDLAITGNFSIYHPYCFKCIKLANIKKREKLNDVTEISSYIK